jgi:hypothetical protein
MRFRSVLLCAGMCATVWLPALVLQAQEPASYPHDMTDFGCTNKDENVCDSRSSAPGFDFHCCATASACSRPMRRCMSSS